MEKAYWTREKAQIHLRTYGKVVIISGLFSLVIAWNDFVHLGEGVNILVFPYVYNLFAVCFALLQIAVGFALRGFKQWAKIRLLAILSSNLEVAPDTLSVVAYACADASRYAATGNATDYLLVPVLATDFDRPYPFILLFQQVQAIVGRVFLLQQQITQV